VKRFPNLARTLGASAGLLLLAGSLGAAHDGVVKHQAPAHAVNPHETESRKPHEAESRKPHEVPSRKPHAITSHSQKQKPKNQKLAAAKH